MNDNNHLRRMNYLKAKRAVGSTSRLRSPASQRIHFKVNKDDTWTVKKGCCHLLGHIVRSASGQYVFNGLIKELSSETMIKIDAFLKDVNKENQEQV